MRFDDSEIFLTKMNALRASLGAAAAGIKFHVVTADLDSALTDADTAQDLDLSTSDEGVDWPANTRPLAAYTYLTREIAGTGISGLTVQIGDAADPDEMQVATELFDEDQWLWVDAPGTATFARLEATAYAPIARYTSTGGNVAAVTGAVKHVLVYWKLDNPFVDHA